MKISTRIRFEVLKRDSFRCRYCGAEPLAAPLHVDHVIPKSKGGTDDPANLVAACAACNLGKSDVPLEQTPPGVPSPEEVREHTAQVRGFLEASKELQRAKLEVHEALIKTWRLAAGTNDFQMYRDIGMPVEINVRLDSILDKHGYARTAEAIWATGIRGFSGEHAIRYFYGVLRKMADRED